MRRKDLETARGLLIERARAVHDFDGVRTTIVFDGQGNRMDIHEDKASPGLAWVFSPSGITADVMIEKLAMKNKKKQEVTVVSNDSLVAASVRASGAFLISPDEFIEASQRAGKGFARYLKKEDKGLGGISFDRD